MNKNSDPMNILLCLDDHSGSYSRHALVTLLSLFETNPNSLFHIYILSSYLDEKNKQEIENTIHAHTCRVSFVISPDIIASDIRDELRLSRPELTYATFYRLFFCEHIQEDIEKILYLDCDTIVMKDITALYHSDIGNAIIAASADLPAMQYEKKKTLGINQYINAGVLLIDVKKYRAVDVRGALREANKKYSTRIRNDDQDYINIIFKKDIKVFPNTFMNTLVNRKYFTYGREATILHLINKPYSYAMPLPDNIRNLYYSYLKKTSFANENPRKTIIDILIGGYSTFRNTIILLSGYIGGNAGAYYISHITQIPIYLYIKIIGNKHFLDQ